MSYFSGEKVDFKNIPIDYGDISPVYIEILEFIRSIPYGSTATYGEVARRIGRPRSARVVGNAMRINPCPIVVPCHRLVGRNGLGGYSLGIDRKILLLNLEGVKVC
ncbi:MGMT family protein [bacterium]|nr:MGMT family protein [bacterium]